MARSKRDPRTKEELLDRMLRFDFDGDIRNVGAEPATIVRDKANALLLKFPHSGVVFELSVHRPREYAQVARASEERSFTAQDEGPEIVVEEVTPPPRQTGEDQERRQASN